MNAQELTNIGKSLCGHRWQSSFARLLGVDPVTVSRWIKGKQTISPSLEKAIYRLSDKPPLLKPREKRGRATASIFTDEQMTLINSHPNSVKINRPIDTLICSPFDAKPLPEIMLAHEPTYYLREILNHLVGQLSENGQLIIVLPIKADPRILNAVPCSYLYNSSIHLSTTKKQDARVVYQFGRLKQQVRACSTKLKLSDEKPVVQEWILEQYTSPSDTICDPFMGEGRFAHAAHELLRQYIGIEPEIKYWLWARAMVRRGFMPGADCLNI